MEGSFNHGCLKQIEVEPTGKRRRNMDVVSKFLIRVIECYRRNRSNRLPCCRFMPSCSAYAIMAIQKYGAARGVLKATWRFIRCNPLNKNHGVDYP